MTAPARHRDAYLVGRTGCYCVPTVGACDAVLRDLSGRLRRAEQPALIGRLRTDIDRVLDRRSGLTFQHEGTAGHTA